MYRKIQIIAPNSINSNINSIAGTTPPSKLDTTSWKIPKDIKLADEQFNQPGGIDLLIGADLFYQAGAHILEIIQFYKRQLWAGQVVVDQQPYRMAHNQHICHKKTTA